MSWDAIQAQAAISAVGASPAAMPATPGFAAAQPAVGAPDFARMIGEGLGEVNGHLLTSQVSLQRLATGDVQNLHQVMMGLEETKVSFQLMLQVRNRMLEAYQDLMKMQI